MAVKDVSSLVDSRSALGDLIAVGSILLGL
jgi:hypothetical protein